MWPETALGRHRVAVCAGASFVEIRKKYLKMLMWCLKGTQTEGPNAKWQHSLLTVSLQLRGRGQTGFCSFTNSTEGKGIENVLWGYMWLCSHYCPVDVMVKRCILFILLQVRKPCITGLFHKKAEIHPWGRATSARSYIFSLYFVFRTFSRKCPCGWSCFLFLHTLIYTLIVVLEFFSQCEIVYFVLLLQLFYFDTVKCPAVGH